MVFRLFCDTFFISAVAEAHDFLHRIFSTESVMQSCRTVPVGCQAESSASIWHLLGALLNTADKLARSNTPTVSVGTWDEAFLLPLADPAKLQSTLLSERDAVLSSRDCALSVVRQVQREMNTQISVAAQICGTRMHYLLLRTV